MAHQVEVRSNGAHRNYEELCGYIAYNWNEGPQYKFDAVHFAFDTLADAQYAKSWCEKRWSDEFFDRYYLEITETQ